MTFLNRFDPAEPVPLLAGETHFPVTTELLELLTAKYSSEEFLLGLLGHATSGLSASPAVLDFIAAFATEQGDEAHRQIASSSGNASWQLACTAFPGMMTLHSIQMFVWKHSVEKEHLWKPEEVAALRALCGEAAVQEAWPGATTMEEAAKQVIG
ncbi:hypothetical protein QBL02_12130 [Leucobacter sp. UT-8R-CII-1-4]|uniref:hypothetical protein n=1 Tax=Leucobacter sp. UT-8R-CII-1-4 TaxID=3040075 RepID=UPI0024A7BF1F|nr:hypothetical protein [Leucobacter sp. UT-8R-CII-1-4]MDI6024288.1 hypothetical protein [Leucobacter sp. UT-8R-CII-1-4]